jgi:hypothetical protein
MASEPLTRATIPAITIPTTIPSARASVRFKEASPPNSVTASDVDSSHATSEPRSDAVRRRVRAVAATSAAHLLRQRIYFGMVSIADGLRSEGKQCGCSKPVGAVPLGA